MDLPFENAVAALLGLLEPREREVALVYAVEHPVGPCSLALPGLALDVREPSWLAFIDAEPGANWGHPARYLLMGHGGGLPRSVPVRFPPPLEGPGGLQWRLVYRAPALTHPAAEFPQP